MTVDRQQLASHPFFENLTGAQLGELLPCVREVHFREGIFIFREGGDADTLYLLRSGCVVLEQHIPGRGAVAVESLSAGDLLGLSWLFPAAHWTMDARTVEPVEAFSLSADCVQERMHKIPKLGLVLATHLVHALYHRLIRVRLQRLDVYKAEG